MDLMGIDIGKMQTFVEVANYLSFTKAAIQLHTTQSVVSKQIMSIENMLQMQLFLRMGSSVRLTPAGKSLHEDWKRILKDIAESINTANSKQHGYIQMLRIGYCNSVIPGNIAKNYVLNESEPVYFSRHQYPELLSKLTSGDLDLIYYGLFDLSDLNHDPFQYKIMGQSRLVACVLSECPLVQKGQVEIKDLKGFSFIMLSPLVSPAWFNTVTGLCNKEGFSPRIYMYVDEVSSLFMNLQKPDQVVLTDYNVLDSSVFSNTTIIPIKNTVSGSIFVWNKNNNNVAIPKYLKYAEEYFNTYDVVRNKQITE